MPKSERMHCSTDLQRGLGRPAARRSSGWRPFHAEAAQLGGRARKAVRKLERISMASNSSRIRYCQRMASWKFPAPHRSKMRRVISGTALLPGVRAAVAADHEHRRQPPLPNRLRNEKSGREGRTAEIIRIIKARSPEGILDPHHARELPPAAGW